MKNLQEYSYHATHQGPFRLENQDALICRPDLGIYAVADGAGGHVNGRLAATRIIDTIAALPTGLPPEERLSALRRAVDEAHSWLRARSTDGHNGAVSTVVALLLEGHHFVVLWAGDSRAYLQREGELMQLTHDHSIVQEMVDAGSISESESRHHPKAHVITRAVGSADDAFRLDKRIGIAMPRDRFLLCSDGLVKTLEDDEVNHLLAQDGDTAQAMLAVALRRRARDNVSVIVVVRP